MEYQIMDGKLLKIGNVNLYLDKITLDLSPRILSDIIREKLSDKGIGLIGINSQENNSLLCIITKDFKDSIHAGHIIKNIAKKIGIGGGGSQFMATMKIDNKISLEKVLDIGKRIIKDELK